MTDFADVKEGDVVSGTFKGVVRGKNGNGADPGSALWIGKDGFMFRGYCIGLEIIESVEVLGRNPYPNERPTMMTVQPPAGTILEHTNGWLQRIKENGSVSDGGVDSIPWTEWLEDHKLTLFSWKFARVGPS